MVSLWVMNCRALIQTAIKTWSDHVLRIQYTVQGFSGELRINCMSLFFYFAGRLRREMHCTVFESNRFSTFRIGLRLGQKNPGPRDLPRPGTCPETFTRRCRTALWKSEMRISKGAGCCRYFFCCLKSHEPPGPGRTLKSH